MTLTTRPPTPVIELPPQYAITKGRSHRTEEGMLEEPFHMTPCSECFIEEIPVHHW